MTWQSLMHDLGTPAPAFAVADSTGRVYTPADFNTSKALLVAFICNHCPFVLHMLDGLVRFAADYAPRGLATVAISSNDSEAVPEDGPQQMAALARARGFGFPYLFDASQQAAKQFGAVCTPDLFLYDGQRKLYYRGQYDASRPKTPHTSLVAVPVSGDDLRNAADALLSGAPPPAEQRPSMGCSMKWRPGNEPEWG
jgi:peroxiredoxin